MDKEWYNMSKEDNRIIINVVVIVLGNFTTQLVDNRIYLRTSIAPFMSIVLSCLMPLKR